MHSIFHLKTLTDPTAPASLLYAETPLGHICLTQQENAISRLDFLPFSSSLPPSSPTPLLREAEAQLLAYLAGKLRHFTIPLILPAASNLRRRCWEGLLQIPYGETWSYTKLATYAGNEKACRAAGGACHNNPISIFIPCHRVVGKDGSLTGFGSGLPRKAALLALESSRKIPYLK